MPHYPVGDVKLHIRSGNVLINPNALQDAMNDFGWDACDIKRCLLKLNGRNRSADPLRNHFHKSEPHRQFPGTMMDYYKAESIMEGNSIYTHFYIHPTMKKLVVSSFKEL